MSLGIVFITGQSNPKSCDLSPLQKHFGQLLEGEGRVLHPTNFPYQSNLEAHRPVHLIKASYANYASFRHARSSHFSERYSPQVAKLFKQYTHVLFLAGSCGLELLNNLRLPEGALQRMSVLAYGPVTRSSADLPVTIVKGRYDFISCFNQHKADYVVACGHMGYLSSPEFQRIALKQVESLVND